MRAKAILVNAIKWFHLWLKDELQKGPRQIAVENWLVGSSATVPSFKDYMDALRNCGALAGAFALYTRLPELVANRPQMQTRFTLWFYIAGLVGLFLIAALVLAQIYVLFDRAPVPVIKTRWKRFPIGIFFILIACAVCGSLFLTVLNVK